MTPQQKTIVDLVRLGLKGDVPSIRRLATKMLRERPSETGEDSAFRDTLAKLVLEDSQGPQITREASRLGAPVDPGTFMSLIRAEHPTEAPSALLSPEAAGVIQQIIDERKNPEVLVAAGIEPTHTLLMTGPPGVGKTMTARFLAASLGVPLLVVDLSTVMSSYLGRTGQNLRQVLDHAKSMRCVFLIDEFDALGKKRDDPSDVGELKRIVNVLLLELDQWPASSLLVAATNHPELLDRAVWRRFERVLQIGLPDMPMRRGMIVRALAALSKSIDDTNLDLVAQVTEGASGADIELLVRGAVRAVALSRSANLGEQLRDAALNRLYEFSLADINLRILYCGIMNRVLGVDQTTIGKQFGVTHVPISRLAAKWDKQQGIKRATRRGAKRVAKQRAN